MKYLFLFTIGPVQTFIAQARKTRDLYRGSKILSDLTTHALTSKEIKEVIFPDKELSSKPNRIMVIIEKETDDEVKSFGEELSQMVQEKYLSMSLGAIGGGKELPSGCDTQLAQAVESYWASLPIDSEEDYSSIYLKAEALLASVKNYRHFKQLQEPGGRKCSLCGERNALFYKGTKYRDLQTDAVAVKQSDLDQGEALCSVCYSKRSSGRENSFESTAEIALLDTLEKLRSDGSGFDALSDYDKSCGGNADAQLYFSENLTKKYFERNRISDADLPALLKKKGKILKVAGELGLKFSPYYAIFMADADNMGEWISGKYLKDKKRLKEFQQTLSKALGKFANEMKTSLGGGRSSLKKGRTIYAGGDDFLGFVNLNHLIPFMDEFRIKFTEIVGSAVAPYVDGSEITISGGAVIAHYKTPLSEALNAARAVEKEAKETFPEKDAFALSVIKHSGERETTCQKWAVDNLKVISLTGEISASFLQDDFSKTYMINLERELLKMGSREESLDLSSEMLEVELERLLNRACMMSRRQGESGSDFKKRKEDEIRKLIDKIGKLKLYTPSLSSFLSVFSIAEFISRYLNGKGE